jgi:trigger factor
MPASLVALDITADDDEFAAAMTKAYRRVARDIQVPGFRKGKAPRNVIERFYGRDVFLRDAADEVMDALYRKALEQEDITPVGEPSVEINELEPVNFVVTVPVFPTVVVNDYASVRIDPVDAAVDDTEVEEVLVRLQKSRGEWVTPAEARTAQEGDQVTVDYEVTVGDEPFQEPVSDAVFILGETNLLQSLRDKLQEMTVGATDSFELAFDEDDETADPSIRGKSLSYTVTLKDLKERTLPALDDEFAMQVNETATLDELREQIRGDIHMGKTTDGRTGVVNQIIAAMAEQAEIDPPAVMIEEEVDHQLNHLKEDLQRSNTPWEGYLRLQGKSEDDIKDDLRPEATRRLRNSLFLQEVAKQETIEVSDEDIEAEIERMTGSVNPADEAAAAQAARMAEFYKSDYFRNMLKNELYERKLSDRLIEIATEGQGAVLNAYVAPDPVFEVTSDDDRIIDAEIVSDATDGVEAEAEIEAPEAIVEEVAAIEDAETVTEEVEFANAVPGDGTAEAPEGYPIKGNADSMIYHVPGGGSYDATIAEYYFATEEEAEAAGFREALNSPAREVAGRDGSGGAPTATAEDKD